MLARLSSKSIAKHPAQTPLEYAQVIRDLVAHPVGILVTEISQAYTAWRYGAEPQSIDKLQELLNQLKKSNRSESFPASKIEIQPSAAIRPRP
jgi:protein-glutamine gamma-glutamyltransferase